MKKYGAVFFFFLLGLGPLFAQRDKPQLLRPAAGEPVGRYETAEIGFVIRAVEAEVNAYFADSETGLNPYDPQKITVKATFTSGVRVLQVNAYYMQDAFADGGKNMYVAAPSSRPWRLRFAPPDTGNWKCVIEWKRPGAAAQALPELYFRCTDAGRHGPLRIHENKTRLVHEDGTPFFAIGQNIAWADRATLKGEAGPAPVYTAGYYDTYHYLHNIADNGGNYARIVLVDWSMNYEWEKAGKYSQERAAVLDSIFRIAEERDIKIMVCLTMMVHPDDAWGWKNHPYRKLVNPSDDQSVLLTDTLLRRFEKNRFRYFFSRWGYSPQLASVELLSEQDLWVGYSDEKFLPWMKDMVRFIRNDLRSDVLLSTCFGPVIHPVVFDQPEMQLTGRHSYHNERRRNQRRYSQLHGSKGLLKKWDKPAIFDEMGIVNGPGNNCDADDVEYCNDKIFHDDLWATAFTGMYGAGLNWWQWKNDGYRAANFPALAGIIKQVNINDFTDADSYESAAIETFYLRGNQDSAGSVAIGWVHNKTYWWGNVQKECKDRSGKAMPLPKDDDKATVPVDKTGEKFTISGLKALQTYRVTFYSTSEAGRKIADIGLKSDLAGRIRIPMQAGSDYAFILTHYKVNPAAKTKMD